jgi:hypothetical protein
MVDREPKSTAALDDVVARIVAIAALGGIATVHVLQLPDAFGEVGYLGALFVVLAALCLALAALMTRTSDNWVWLVAGALPVLVIVGFLLSRTSGLPGFTSDVGEWDRPLALAALVFESLLICVSAAVLAPRYAHVPVPPARSAPLSPPVR